MIQITDFELWKDIICPQHNSNIQFICFSSQCKQKLVCLKCFGDHDHNTSQLIQITALIDLMGNSIQTYQKKLETLKYIFTQNQQLERKSFNQFLIEIKNIFTLIFEEKQSQLQKEFLNSIYFFDKSYGQLNFTAVDTFTREAIKYIKLENSNGKSKYCFDKQNIEEVILKFSRMPETKYFINQLQNSLCQSFSNFQQRLQSSEYQQKQATELLSFANNQEHKPHASQANQNQLRKSAPQLEQQSSPQSQTSSAQNVPQQPILLSTYNPKIKILQSVQLQQEQKLQFPQRQNIVNQGRHSYVPAELVSYLVQQTITSSGRISNDKSVEFSGTSILIPPYYFLQNNNNNEVSHLSFNYAEQDDASKKDRVLCIKPELFQLKSYNIKIQVTKKNTLSTTFLGIYVCRDKNLELPTLYQSQKGFYLFSLTEQQAIINLTFEWGEKQQRLICQFSQTHFKEISIPEPQGYCYHFCIVIQAGDEVKILL